MALNTHKRIALLLLLLFSVCLNGYRLYHNVNLSGFDSSSYVTIARNLVDGYGFTLDGENPDIWWTPGYPLIVALFEMFIDNIEISALLPVFLLGIALVFLVFLFATSLFNSNIGFLAAILVALNSLIVTHSTTAMPDIPYTVTILLAAYLMWQAIEHAKRPPKFLLLATFIGGILGISYLLRFEGVLYLFIFILIICFRKFADQPLKRRIFFIGLMSAAFFCVAFTYNSYLYKNSGLWFSPKGKRAFLFGERNYEVYGTSDVTVYRVDRDLPEDTWKTEALNLDIQNYFKRNFVNILKRYYHGLNNLREMLLDHLGFLLVSLLVLGLFSEPWSSSLKKKNLFILLMVSPLLSYPLFVIIERYLVFCIPFFLILAARGLDGLNRWFCLTVKKRNFIINVIVIAILFRYSSPMIFGIGEPGGWGNKAWLIEYKHMGSWMNRNIPNPQDIRIACFDSKARLVRLHSGSKKPVKLFEANAIDVIDDALLEAIRKSKSQYLILDEDSDRKLSRRQPHSVMSLLENKQDQFLLKHTVKRPKKVALYEIVS